MQVKYNGMRATWLIILLTSVAIICGSMLATFTKDPNSGLSMLMSQSLMIVPLVVGIITVKHTSAYVNLKEDLGFNGFNPVLMLLLLILPGATSVFSSVVQLPVTEILVKIFGPQTNISCPETVESFIWLFLSLCVVAPVFEEIIFRGIAMSLLMPYGTLVSVIVSAFGFSMLHFAPVVFIAIFVVGIVLGFVRVYTNSVYSCILFHSVFNFLSLMQIVFEKELEGMFFETVICAFIMLCLFPILFFILYKTSKFKKLQRGYVKWGGNGIIPMLLMIVVYSIVALLTAFVI